MVGSRRDVHGVNCKFLVFGVFRYKGFYLKDMDAVPVLGGFCLIFLVLPGITLH
jgi:hypothetical protein